MVRCSNAVYLMPYTYYYTCTTYLLGAYPLYTLEPLGEYYPGGWRAVGLPVVGDSRVLVVGSSSVW